MDCCDNSEKKRDKKDGIGKGIFYGIIPHLGCLGFIIFSILGVTVATTVFRFILMTPYLLHILIGLSLILATFSLVIYLKRIDKFSFSGLLEKKGYATALYGTTLAVNLLFFLVIFPAVAGIDSGVDVGSLSADTSGKILQVDIPCEGHSFLINNELNQVNGVENVEFSSPNYFEVFYNKEKVDLEEILSLEVFDRYKATVER